MTFQQISIRGRFSFSLKCVSNYINKFSLESKVANDIINIYSSFTKTNELDNWYEECKEFTPSFYSTYKDRSILKCKYISEEMARKIQAFYSGSPKDLTALFQLTFDIGIEHLYSIVSGNITISFVDKVVDILNKNAVEIPDIKFVEFSRIEEDRGWGKEFEWESIWG